MDFYLSFNNGDEQLRLPVTPSEFEVSQRQNNTVVNITSLGEINLLGKKGLFTVSLASFFPSKDYYFCKYQGFPAPYDCVNMIQQWQKSGRPIRLIVTESPLNIACTIENFSYGERDGSGDVYFSIELREYVFTSQATPTIVPEEKKFTTSNGTEITQPITKRETKPVPKTYKPQKDDNAYKAAKKATGNMKNANPISERNKISNRKNLGGQELII